MFVCAKAWRYPSQRQAPTARCRHVSSTRTLLIDNYDSYTYNLYQLISLTHKREPVVALNDAVTTEQVQQMIDKGIESIVISPGPGHPDNPKDTGVCPELFRKFPDVPILGVCLGHQILASVYGGQTKRAKPVHGRLSGVVHNGHPLFKEIPSSGSELQVVRYHSLAVDKSTLPECLEPIAWTSGGSHTLNCSRLENTEGHVLMALAHKEHPHYGVQFHPESIATNYGAQILKNFQSLTQQHKQRNHIALPKPEAPETQTPIARGAPLKVIWRKISSQEIDVDGLFDCLFGKEAFEDTFWLDSAAKERCRFSFMGGPGGNLWKKLTYRLTSASKGILTITNRHKQHQTWSGSLWDFLKTELQRHQTSHDPDLPFNFCGGFVGYLGYELKALCGGQLTYASPTPDAALFFADRLVVIDHELGDVYCLAVFQTGSLSDRAEAEEWTLHTLHTTSQFLSTNIRQPYQSVPNSKRHEWELDRNQSQYEADVLQCKEFLHAGDSYEICLTNKFRKKHDKLSERALYRHLRHRNPAPYAAWLRFGGGAKALTICCSSPERFLKGDRDGTLEAKPIKGTSARSEDPIQDAASAEQLKRSEKNQAENLMIVDLLRNDLGRVCRPSSIHVPALMEVESFTTVHQLVSTVCGTRRRDVSIVDAIQAAFPGGSMTGAPKIRTMEILDKLERAPRGIYSGSIGYLSINDTFDLNIVIRTAIVTDGEIVIGSGGAIVLQSDATAEFSEMTLKAQALLEAIGQWETETVHSEV